MKISTGKLFGTVVCILLLTTIPLASGMTIETTPEPEKETEGLFGWAWVRGWLVNAREVGDYISGRAIKLHFIEFSGLETKRGMITLKLVNFKAGVFLDINYLGPLGSLAYVRGFIPGGIDIQE